MNQPDALHLKLALDFIGEGTSLNKFCEQYEHMAQIILDRLKGAKIVEVVYSRKYKITLIMPLASK